MILRYLASIFAKEPEFNMGSRQKVQQHIFRDLCQIKIDRFTKVDKEVERWAYMPFIKVKRACLDKNLAEMVASVLVTVFGKSDEIRKP